MKNYVYYRRNSQVIGMRLTKTSFKKVLELIANHGSTEKYAANSEQCYIHFTQRWPLEKVLELKRGMYVTSNNAGLKIYSKWDFENNFTRIYSMPSYYTPTEAEAAVLECLNRDAEMCYPYSYICEQAKLTREQAKAAIDRLREFGAVEYWRGLMDDEGDVAGSGFCWGDPHKAEALLYRYYGNGK